MRAGRIVGQPIVLADNALDGPAGGAVAVVPVPVEVLDVVEFGDCFLGSDFGGESGC